MVNSVKSSSFVTDEQAKLAVTKNSNWDNDLEDSEEFQEPLSRAELEGLLGANALKPSRINVRRILLMQLVVTLLSGIAWSAKGKPFTLDSPAISAVLGGLAALVPALLFALRTRVMTGGVNVAGASVLALVTGELLKIIATVAMFILVVVFYPGLVWFPLLLTYILTLKCYWLAWILR
jgi:ATP synthase protein I